MGGKKGGGSSQSGFVPQPAGTTSPELSAFLKEFTEQSRPVRQDVFAQINEAQRTGGIGAQIPSIQKSVEASRAATSGALRGFDEQSASAGPGFAGSEFSKRIRALMALSGAQETEAIPTTYAKQLSDVAPALALGSASTLTSGLVPMSQLGLQSTISRQQVNAQQQAAKGQSDSATIGAIVSIAAIAAQAYCWIAETLYGRYSVKAYRARLGLARWDGPTAAFVRWVYVWAGPLLARRRWLCLPLKPLFDAAVRRGR